MAGSASKGFESIATPSEIRENLITESWKNWRTKGTHHGTRGTTTKAVWSKGLRDHIPVQGAGAGEEEPVEMLGCRPFLLFGSSVCSILSEVGNEFRDFLSKVEWRESGVDWSEAE